MKRTTRCGKYNQRRQYLPAAAHLLPAMHQTRSFGNDSCPATRFTRGYAESRQHTFCYGPYATGELGANISARLGLCCNATTDQSRAAPVEVVLDPLGYGLPDTGNCYFACNATYLEGPRALGGEVAAFSDLERCLEKPVDTGEPGLDGSEASNPYHIRCTGREISVASRVVVVPRGASSLGLVLSALVVFFMAWT